MALHCVEVGDVLAAHARIRSFVHRTPVLTSSGMDAMASEALGVRVELFFKCENFQKTGSFKARGASNATLLAKAAGATAVCTHSSGNHAGALAWAGSLTTPPTPAHIVMPRGAPASKVSAVVGYGGLVRECEPTQAAREAAAKGVAEETGAEFVHPSEDPRVIAGQGTLGLEILEQVRELVAARSGETGEAGEAGRGEGQGPAVDVVVVPVGGGGLIGGTATAVKGTDARVRVVGAEPAAADDAYRSKREGSIQPNLQSPPQTVADGLKTTLGPNTWPLVRDRVDAIATVEEPQIRAALRTAYVRLKLVLEPSAAVGVAAVLSAAPALRAQLWEAAEAAKAAGGGAAGRPLRVAVVLCGGNLDLEALPQYIAA